MEDSGQHESDQMEVNVESFVDLDASTIATLAEFSEVDGALFLALTSRWSESFAKTVFEAVNVTGWEVLFGTSSNHSYLMESLIKHKGSEATQILIGGLLSRGGTQKPETIVIDIAGWEVLFNSLSNHTPLIEDLIKYNGMEATRSLVKSLLSRASTSKNAKMIPVLSKLLKSTTPSPRVPFPVKPLPSPALSAPTKQDRTFIAPNPPALPAGVAPSIVPPVPPPPPSVAAKPSDQDLSTGRFNEPTQPSRSSLPILKSTGPKSTDTQEPPPPHANPTSEPHQPASQSSGDHASKSNLYVDPERPSQSFEPLSPPRPMPRPSQPMRPQLFPMEDLNHPASETRSPISHDEKQPRKSLPPSVSPLKPSATAEPRPRTGNTARVGPAPPSPHTIPPSQDAVAETVPPVHQLLESEEAWGSDERGPGEPEEIEDSGETQITSSVNPWDAATNAQMVEEWGIEERIHDQPMHTAPARTQWMYEDRKKALGMTDEEYEALTDREYADFMKVPVAARGHAGLIYHKKSKFDWEVRVRLGKIAYDYYQLDEPEDREYLRAALVEVEKRFPDLSPTHILRRIDEQGHKAVEKWWMDIAKWVQTAAGKMRATLEELEGHVEILVGKKKNVKYDPTKLLGFKRAEVNYVLWGRSKSGTSKCHPLIEEEMAIWKEENQGAIEEDGRIVGQHRVGVEGRIRKDQYALQPASVKEHYDTLAKGGVALTPEQQKAAAEVLISNLVNTCSRSSTVANMHILVFVSTVTTGDRIPVVMKEFGADTINGPFLDGQELGTRVKSEYTGYASRLWKGDKSQIDLLDKTVEEEPSSAGQGRANKGKTTGASAKSTKSNKPTQQNDSNKSKGKRNAAPAVSDNPQRPTKPSYREWKPLAAVRTEKQRIDYMTSFFGSTYCNNFSGQMKWNPISANNNLYIDPVRQPEDQHGDPLPLLNPQAMPGPLFQSWWTFLEACANGEILEDRRFMWKSEETRINLPDIAAPDDPSVHAAGELARSTVPRKRARGETKGPRKSQKRKSKMKPKSAADYDDDEIMEDLEDLQEDAEKWGATPDNEPGPSRALRRRPSQAKGENPASSKSVGHESGESSESEGSGTEGSNFEPAAALPPLQKGSRSQQVEASSRIGPEAKSSARTNGRRIVSEEPEDLEPTPAKIPQVAPPAPVASGSEAPQAISSQSASPSNVPQSSEDLISPSLHVPSSARTPRRSEPKPIPSEVPRQSEPTTIPSEPPRQSLPATSSEASPRQPQPTTVPPLTPRKSLTPPKRSQKRIADPGSPPTLEQVYSEILLGHPQFLSAEQMASGSPAWLQLRNALTLWGSKIASLNVADCQISLSSSARKPDLTLPPVLTSAISIAQLFTSFQKPDPHTPDCPIVKISPTCGLDSLSQNHHLRQVVELVLDVQAPLPTAKSVESNIPLQPEALRAFFGILEKALATFLNALTRDQETLRHAEVEYLMMIRLALFVRSTSFMADDGLWEEASRRITSLLDRLVVVLGAVATIRYMEVYVGRGAEMWFAEEGPKRNHASQMWFYIWRLMKTGIPSLASALTGGRSDVFNYRGIDAVIPSTLKSVFDHALAQAPWWSPPGNGIPKPFVFGLKQWIPSLSLFECLQNVEWSRLSFIDRVVVLMTIFTAALQLSAEPADSALLKAAGQDSDESLIERLERCCSYLMRVIEGTEGREDGPKVAEEAAEKRVQMEKNLRGWLSVWESEQGPEVPFVPHVPGQSNHGHPEAIPSSPACDSPGITGPAPSQGSSIVPATPSVNHHDEEEAGEEPPMKLPSIAEEDDEEEGGLDGGLAEGSPEEEPEDAEEAEAEALLQTPGPKKRKVKVGAPRVRPPPPKRGVGENPMVRLRRAAKEAVAKREEAKEADVKEAGSERRSRLHRRAHFQSPYVSSTPAVHHQQAEQAQESPRPSGSKRPRAAAAKAKAAAKADEPRGSPQQISLKEKRAKAARKAAATRAANKAKKAGQAVEKE